MSEQVIFERVKAAIASGFQTDAELRADLPEIVELALGAPDKAALARVERFLTQQLDRQRHLEQSWQGRTVNDGIDAAFEALNAAGIIALQNVGMTLSDAWWTTHALAEQREEHPYGAVMYTYQDLEQGLAGQGMQLAFTAYEEDPKLKPDKVRAVGKEVCAVLAANGVQTRWSGAPDVRIVIPPFEWKRRRKSA